MLKIQKDGKVMSLEVGGGLNEICIDLCYVLTAIHQRMEKEGADMAKCFKECMVAAVTAPDSPVWEQLQNATIIEIDKDALGRR